MWGEVNDSNSFHRGGTAGNAGLFATASSVFRLAQAWARHELLPEALVRTATSLQTEGLNQRRALGRQIAEDTTGAPLTSDSYGHIGFTGTSV